MPYIVIICSNNTAICFQEHIVNMEMIVTSIFAFSLNVLYPFRSKMVFTIFKPLIICHMEVVSNPRSHYLVFYAPVSIE